jgi:hypothetical protein
MVHAARRLTAESPPPLRGGMTTFGGLWNQTRLRATWLRRGKPASLPPEIRPAAQAMTISSGFFSQTRLRALWLRRGKPASADGVRTTGLSIALEALAYARAGHRRHAGIVARLP